MKKLCWSVLLCLCIFSTHAQVGCDSIEGIFRNWDARLDKLNYQDPEIITLHYYFLQDILKEMEVFRQNTVPNLPNCKQLDYYQTMAAFDRVAYHARVLEHHLEDQRHKVDYLFYLRAIDELAFKDTTQAFYNLDRSLQFNKLQPDALLLKAKLLLAEGQYQNCVDIIHLLYTKAELNAVQEMKVSDFSIVLYDKLYFTGDSLVKIDKAADALEIFSALEQFCSNMPSGYCNDDYYRGILRSRQGVYESYIAIAKEAERRHNPEMARKFYDYAEDYRRQNDSNGSQPNVTLPKQ